jgi:hypothetical protein
MRERDEAIRMAFTMSALMATLGLTGLAEGDFITLARPPF